MVEYKDTEELVRRLEKLIRENERLKNLLSANGIIYEFPKGTPPDSHQPSDPQKLTATDKAQILCKREQRQACLSYAECS